MNNVTSIAEAEADSEVLQRDLAGLPSEIETDEIAALDAESAEVLAGIREML